MKNYTKIVKSQKEFSFFGDEKHEISIKEYLNRINSYCNPEKSTFIISLF